MIGLNRSMPRKAFAGGPGVGQNVYRQYSREGARRGDAGHLINNNLFSQQPMPTVKPLSRIPQHRQTNLANVMESIREEDPHL